MNKANGTGLKEFKNMKPFALLFILLIGMIGFTGLGNTATDLSKNSNVVTQNDEAMSKIVVVGFHGAGLTALTLAELKQELETTALNFVKEDSVVNEYKINEAIFYDVAVEAPDLPEDNHPKELHNFNKNLQSPFHPYPTYRRARDGLRYSF